jgi:hypothetical protein
MRFSRGLNRLTSCGTSRATRREEPGQSSHEQVHLPVDSSSFHRSSRHALDEEFPHQNREDQDGQHDHGSAGGDLASCRPFVVHEDYDSDRSRHRLIACQNQSEEEVIPAVEADRR